MIDAIGHESVEVSTIDEALRALSSSDRFDCGLVDLNLSGVKSYPVAEALAAAGVPFAFSSGYNVGDVEPQFSARPFLTKPFRIQELEDVLTQLREERPADDIA